VRPETELTELRLICPGLAVRVENTYEFIFLPSFRLPTGAIVDALLCPQSRDGYETRLFLSSQVPGKGNNWTTHSILDRTWYTWSWNNVPATFSLAAILANHLEALK
jgi:hypothetical protein